MPLAPGTLLGPYKIESPIGAGGMGEVYLATDPRVGRTVAIKVSSARFSERFEREARAIAQLNHPNICTLYDVGPDYLVMEYVEGPTLAERIKEGPIPLDEALAIARQMAAAFDEAHEKGVVHRDLKPGNVKVKSDGAVKVLDFGLAKIGPGSSNASNSEFSPTMTMGMTEAGVILGTASYMSPEQARGKNVDKRADIWAFGVVLWEMLTGERMFTGETVTDVLAQVVTKAPDLERAPQKVRRLLRKCLEKDPRKRLRDIGDFEVLLEEAPPAPAAVPEPEPAKPASKLPWAIAAGLLLTTLGAGFVAVRHATEEQPRLQKFSLLPPEKATMRRASDIPQLSPDGRRLAFAATVDGKDTLWVRELDSLNARSLAGTEGAQYPFWAPDSRWLAFFADGKLKKIDVTGGPALTLADAPNGRLGTWNRDDVIVFAPSIGGGLFRVPAAGGAATQITEPDRTAGEDHHRAPWFLPDGRHFLYTARSEEDAAKSRIWVTDLQNPKDRRLVAAADSNAVYVPPQGSGTGHILFERERTLMAQPFDPSKLQTTGDAVPVAEQVEYFPGSSQAQFSASQNGVLVYLSNLSEGGNAPLTLFDRTGKPSGEAGEAFYWGMLSPDGSTVAMDRADRQTRLRDIWLHDLARGTDSRFTFGPQLNDYPVWSPDGSHIAFASYRSGGSSIFQRAIGGGAQDELLAKFPGFAGPTDWSRDGRYLIVEVVRRPNEIWVLPISEDKSGEHKPFPFLQSSFNERRGRLSPNGQFLAYESNESSRYEVYVQTFPALGGEWQISTGGGFAPVWSRDGRELFFISADNKMMAVEIKTGIQNGKPVLSAGAAKALFDVNAPVNSLSGNGAFDVTKDGRFLLPAAAEQVASVPLTVVLNWTTALKK